MEQALKKTLAPSKEFSRRTGLYQHVRSKLAQTEAGRAGVVEVMNLRRHPALVGEGDGNALRDFIEFMVCRCFH